MATFVISDNLISSNPIRDLTKALIRMGVDLELKDCIVVEFRDRAAEAAFKAILDASASEYQVIDPHPLDDEEQGIPVMPSQVTAKVTFNTEPIPTPPPHPGKKGQHPGNPSLRRPCANCGELFNPWRKDQRYCSKPDCQKALVAARKSGRKKEDGIAAETEADDSEAYTARLEALVHGGSYPDSESASA